MQRQITKQPWAAEESPHRQAWNDTSAHGLRPAEEGYEVEAVEVCPQTLTLTGMQTKKIQLSICKRYETTCSAIKTIV